GSQLSGTRQPSQSGGAPSAFSLRRAGRSGRHLRTAHGSSRAAIRSQPDARSAGSISCTLLQPGRGNGKEQLRHSMTITATQPEVSDKVKVVSPPEVFAFPVSSAQKRFWFLGQFHPDSPLYNIPIAVRLEGPIDAVVLEQALNHIVRRHEVLRTRFDL